MHTPDNVLIVGGSSEIGVEIAKALAKRGSTKFVLAGRSFETMQRAANEISSANPAGATSVSVIYFDVLAENAVSELITSTTAELSTIDMTIFAIGTLGDQAQLETDLKAAQEILEANFSKLAPAIQGIANVMVTQGFGHIVVLSSVAGVRVRRSNYFYGSAKAGLDGFAMALNDAVIKEGVNVTVVRPGFVRTKMTAHLPAAPLSTTAAAVAKATLAATDKQRNSVYVPTAIGVVVNIYRLLPRFIARKVPF